MFKNLFSSRPKAVQSSTAFRVQTTLRLPNAELAQTQVITEHYVVSEVNRQTILYLASADQRYMVDRVAKTLKAVNPSPQQVASIEALRRMVGEVAYAPDGDDVEVDGRLCRRLTIAVETPQLVMSGEALATRIPGLAGTALPKERALDARLQPFRMPLADDEIPVRSTTRLLAAGSEQNQSSALLSVEEGVAVEEYDAFTAFKVVD